MIKSDKTLDCVGLFCPMPIVKTKLELDKMSVGQVLEVLSDDPGIRNDMPSWCETTGNEFLGNEEDGDVIKSYVRKVK